MGDHLFGEEIRNHLSGEEIGAEPDSVTHPNAGEDSSLLPNDSSFGNSDFSTKGNDKVLLDPDFSDSPTDGPIKVYWPKPINSHPIDIEREADNKNLLPENENLLPENENLLPENKEASKVQQQEYTE